MTVKPTIRFIEGKGFYRKFKTSYSDGIYIMGRGDFGHIKTVTWFKGPFRTIEQAYYNKGGI